MEAVEIFYSYSHKDESLRDALETHFSLLKRQGFIATWHDRRITAGSEWAGEIDDHLNTAKVVLLLISPDFLSSDYCYDLEMKRALERHAAGEARIVPVLLRPVDWKGAPFARLQGLPKNLRPVTLWPDRDEAFADVAAGIRALVEAIRVGGGKLPPEEARSDNVPYRGPFQAPPLPAHFIPRPEVMDLLKPQVLEERDRQHSDALIISALRGQGGIGKSTLAAALAQDAEVQSRFPDGILWATLGQNPDLLSLLSGWVQALGNNSERSPVQATTIAAATAQLRSLFHDRAALLVVDDVWNAEEARPFLAGGPRCRVLITTRRADIADDLNARRFELDVMTPEQSLALLASRLDRALEGEEREQAARLAQALGYLPLALELAAARVLRGVDWDDLRGAFEQEVARLEALEGGRRPSRTQTRLEASFNLSLEALRAEDESAWRAFVWLGVLPEDATITAPMAATLWDTNEAEAADLLEWLWNDALLLPGPAVLVGQRRFPGYRVHDLLHDMARRLLIAEEPQGLGLSLPRAHARLLERYQARCADSAWHRLADDGYIHGRLAWHMTEAGQFERIVALLREETAEGQNAWFVARERLGQTAGFLEDVTRAWEMAQVQAEQCIEQGKNAEVVGLELRFALVMASINSLAANIPIALLKALLTRGVWSPEQAMAYAQRTPDRQQRARALATIAEHLGEAQKQQALEEALRVARAIRDESSRAEALSDIAKHLPESEKQLVFEEALAAARTIREESSRAEVLLDIAEHLPESEKQQAFDEALAAAQAIRDARLLSSIALVLAESGIPEQALEAARAIGEESSYRAWTLSSIAEHLPESEKQLVFEEALTAARTIREESSRAEVLSRVAEHLPESEKQQAFEEALAAARALGEEPSSRAEILPSIALVLARSGQAEEALETARAIRDDFDRAWALSSIALVLARSDQPEQALEAARAIGEAPFRTRALSSIARHLPESEKQQAFEEALTAARAIGEESSRAEPLLAVAEHLPESEKQEVLEEALAAARAIGQESSRARILSDIAEHLSESQKQRALDTALAAVRDIGDEGSRAWSLSSIALVLAESGQPEQALAAARSIGDEASRAKALSSIAKHLPEPEKQQALEEALATARAVRDVWLLSSISLVLARLGQPEQALAATRAIGEESSSRAEILPSIALVLAESGQPEQALEVARAIGEEPSRAKALSSIARHLPESEKQQALEEALATARAIRDARLLSSIALIIAESGQLEEALAAARVIGDEFYRAWTLSDIAEYLPESEKQQAFEEALAAARAFREESSSRARLLSRIALIIAESGQPEEALAVARAIRDESSRAEALSSIAEHLPESQKQGTLDEALAVAQAIRDEFYRTWALLDIAEHLPECEHQQALEEALAAARAIGDESPRARVLASVTAQLTQQPPAGLYSLWKEILQYLAAGSRRDLLEVLQTQLAGVIPRLGGTGALTKVAQALEDVGRWWP